MIELFGLHYTDKDRLADLSAMATASDAPRFTTDWTDRRGAAGPNIALGHRWYRKGPRASVAATGDGRFEARFIGDLFNPEDLGAASGSDGASVLLALYRDGALERLADANGLFAAAIADHDAGTLTLITDRYCGLPIHYHTGRGRFAFAGQIATLLAAGGVSRVPDETGLALLFTMQRTVGEGTNLRDVAAMPAATIMTVDPGGKIEKRAYWRLSWAPAFRDEREASEALVAALRAAVNRQTGNGAMAPGILLSGGVDSRLVLTAGAPGAMTSWTTASFDGNPELALASKVAAAWDSPFNPLLVEPSDTFAHIDSATRDANGLYPAPVQFASFMDRVADGADVALTGHGLDYTLRGYYMPALTLKIAGSKTRLPALRGIPANPTGADVLKNLRQGPPVSVIDRIVRAERREFWWQSQGNALHDVLAPWLEGDEPVNAWDAFILHSLSKHYAYTGMMAIRAKAHLRIPAYDADVFRVYLGMPPKWRMRAKVVLDALTALSPEIAAMENANTGMPANHGAWKEILGVYFRAAGRRMGMVARPQRPTGAHSTGSWQDSDHLYRQDPAHRIRFQEICDRLDGLCFNLLDADALRGCIDEHLEGRVNHGKLMRGLLTHDAWVRGFGIVAS